MKILHLHRSSCKNMGKSLIQNFMIEYGNITVFNIYLKGNNPTLFPIIKNIYSFKYRFCTFTCERSSSFLPCYHRAGLVSYFIQDWSGGNWNVDISGGRFLHSIQVRVIYVNREQDGAQPYKTEIKYPEYTFSVWLHY